MTLSPGTRLGPYEVQSTIGAGGMGEVYKARDTRLDRTVAIKVLPPEFSADPERRARLEREAKTIAGLSHPNICTLFDVGDHQGSTFLVMEHLTGETLAQRLQKGPLRLDQALTVATEIADALAAAHRQGVVHRDLKPGNVMLTKAGAKLLDFGLAKLKGHGEQPAAAHLASAPTQSTPLTAEGMIVGTLQYMAPEQLEGKPADARTDLWAFGAILYEMITGKRAFEASSQASLIAAIMSADPAPLSLLRPMTPPTLDRLVQRCLAKDPDQRWESAHDMADELRWATQAADTVATSRSSPPARRRWRWALPAAVALVVLAVGVAAFWLSGGFRPHGGSAVPSSISSVAVLPLENLSGDAGQEYFADGLTDSLISELAQIRALRVISRTSVMRYKGTRKPLKEIAHELNDVGAIVEGTVMRDGGRVTVTVELIETAADAHVWSQSYDRDLTDILTLRREIARSVAQGIRAALEPEDERRLGRRQLVNREAFDSYLRAVDLRNHGATPASIRAAFEAARRAVSLDPTFAQAYVELAFADTSLWWYYVDRSPERASEARSAATKALELDPQLPDAHWAQALVLYQLDLDYEGALKELQVALDRNPSDSTSLAYVAFVKRRQGKLDEAVTYLKKALTLNPLDATALFNLGETYALLRRPDDAERYYDEALRQNPVYDRPLAYKLRWRLRLRPGLAQAREVERQAEAAGLGTDPIVLYHRALLHLAAGDYTGALDLIARTPVNVFEESFWFVPTALLQGQTYNRLGQQAKARERYAEAQRVAEAGLRADPGDSRCHSALGLALAGLGDKAGAIREGKAAVDAMPVTRDTYRGAYRLEDLARIYAAVGERDLAVELLGKLLAMPTDLAAPALALDPSWTPLRGHPDFERLVTSSKRP